MKLTFTRLGSLALLAALATSCSKEELTTPANPTAAVVSQDATRDNNLAMGNPSGAVTDATNYPNNYLMTKTQYTMSYSRDKGKPNWVSWHLSSAWLGSTPRQDNFAADNTLPSTWYHVGSTSYSGSGFDRGHICPSADRTGSVADNSATFLMTNMMPQAPTNNQQTWAGLENYARTLVGQGYECYIIAGSYGTGGTGSAGYATTINSGHITVPSNCWKVLVVLPEGSSDASRVTTSTRVIAVNMPNTNSIGTAWGAYRTTVDAIESATGYDILSAVSSTVQATIESKVDTGPTS
ncbi:DNA/RNA non-specific endonuclease [Hymenobacter sp. BT770]|uniref:DNA/RNA non-specific endonuclease n=1 Tax=Hymenobacter sp. BT770 TaxID=2886942 RepID=UPI001D11A6AE|nr:DNA/RNA non-specific endonuclease [Hymenobacter sp. BT770]MCC3154492.1 DNA/RNA non-specific endonuclease [Hymenobacter sp. BT770]MDO3416444.1 DNA/RNA non-specific endonuclease [Hymenobacter sp. BT770]